jgi:hypothetical protein
LSTSSFAEFQQQNVYEMGSKLKLSARPKTIGTMPDIPSLSAALLRPARASLLPFQWGESTKKDAKMLQTR